MTVTGVSYLARKLLNYRTFLEIESLRCSHSEQSKNSTSNLKMINQSRTTRTTQKWSAQENSWKFLKRQWEEDLPSMSLPAFSMFIGTRALESCNHSQIQMFTFNNSILLEEIHFSVLQFHLSNWELRNTTTTIF